MQKQRQQQRQIRQYEQAYADYKAGMPYRDIAELYNVSLSTVKSWQQRYWRKWDSGTSTSSDSADNTHDGSDSMQTSTHSDGGSMQTNSGTRIDVAKPEKVFKAIVQKQIEDTNPARIYAEYSRENLPELTAREARFVEEYIIDLDKKNAAIRAGYSVAHAESLGCRLFAKPHINAHIQVALAERLKRSGMNADLAIRELARIARANPIRVVRSDGSIDENASEDDLAAIQAIKVKVTPTKNGDIVEREVRFHDKTRALELYMKAAGMLIERKQVDVTQKVEEMTDDERRQRIRELQSKLAIDIDADVIDS